MHRVGQALQRAVERGIFLCETEMHDRGDRIPFIKRGNRDRRDLIVRHDTPAERLVGFIEAERRKVHVGFAGGRFDFMNRAYGIGPRNAVEKRATLGEIADTMRSVFGEYEEK